MAPGQGVPTQYVQERWNKEDGLPQSSVTALVQSRSGYVWFGTQEGLVRFDGQRFTVFLVAQYPGLPSNDILSLLEDQDGRLWVGTNRGLARFDGQTFAPVPAVQNVPVLALYETEQEIWAGTRDGVVRLRGGASQAFDAGDGLPSPIVLALGTDARGRLWAGTLDGVARFNGQRFRPDPALEGQEVRALHRTPDGRFLAGTSGGLSLLWGDAFAPFTPEGSRACANVSALATDAAGHLWVGTKGEGLCALMDGILYPLPASELPDGSVRALAIDAEKGMWVGMEAGGLLRLHRGRFLTLGRPEGLTATSVLAVLEGRDGALWVGTDGGGLNRIQNGYITHYGEREGLRGGLITSLLETRDGTIWTSTFDGGLCRLEGDRFRCLYTKDGLISDYVYALHEDNAGALWIGTGYGLNRRRGGRLENMTTLDPALANLDIRGITSHDGAIWAAAYGGGLVRIVGEQVTVFGTERGLLSLDALVLHVDDAGTLWAGFDEKGGMCRLEAGGQRFRCYDTTDGLLDDRVMQILSDDDGYLWLGSNQGIVRMRLEVFAAYDAGLVSRLSYEPVGLTLHDGLRDPEVNGGIQPTTWRGASGSLYFATAGGVGIVTPDAFEQHRNTRPPPVVIEEVRTGSERLTSINPLLPPRQRDVRFSFAALSFQNPDSVRIRFRLDGHDETWHDLEGHDRSYTYANLNGGSYTFRVQAANADGVWNETGASYTFRVQPHPFETWWFYLLAGLAAVGVGAVLSRARVRRLQRRQEELEQVVEERTSELRAHEVELKRVNEGLESEVQRQLDVILEERRRYEGELISARDRAEESARLKSAILNNMSHEIRTPISAILGFSEILSMEVKGELKEFVQYIDENGKRLLNTLNSVLDLSRIESEGVVLQPEPFDATTPVRGAADMLVPLAARKGLRFQVALPEELPVVSDQFGVERIAGNLISNAIKFTEHGQVDVSLEADGDDFVLVVRDTGVGISESFIPHLFEPFKQESGGLARSHDGSGLGLALVYRYVTAMGGVISVQSAKGQGSAFTVRLPRAPVAQHEVLDAADRW